MGKMTVYHGSYTTVENPSIIKGKNTKDFGTGFYCTVIREQAERWARRYDHVESSPESSSGSWQSSSIRPIRLIFVLRHHRGGFR